jgi:hypothetical protein
MQVVRGCSAMHTGLAYRPYVAGLASGGIGPRAARLDLVGDRKEDQLRHHPNDIARRSVLTSFLVVLLVEPADQFLEYRSHAMVVEAGDVQRDISVPAQHRGWVGGR